MKAIFAAALLATPFFASAQGILLTPRFNITVIGCEEEVISCDNAKYIGVNRKTGSSVTILGRTLHSYERDGVTPNQFFGYEFKSGKTTYRVYSDGVLEVTQTGKPAFSERGTWIGQ